MHVIAMGPSCHFLNDKRENIVYLHKNITNRVIWKLLVLNKITAMHFMQHLSLDLFLNQLVRHSIITRPHDPWRNMVIATWQKASQKNFKIQFDVHTLYKGIKFIIMCQPPPPTPYKIKNKNKNCSRIWIKQHIWIQFIMIILHKLV